MTASNGPAERPIRRPPPPFRTLELLAIDELSPHMARITLGGRELHGLEVSQPAASVRLLTPAPGEDLVIPTWTGNEFLFDDGSRPIIRTFTPRHLRRDAGELDLDVVLHPNGATSAWVRRARLGAQAAVSGTARGHDIDPSAGGYLLAGDETAIPAISQLIEAMPETIRVWTIVEVTAPDARLDLPPHPLLDERWVVLTDPDQPGEALVPAVETTAVPDDTRVWAAGEAAAMHRIRRHLFDVLGRSRREATVRGYWKHGR